MSIQIHVLFLALDGLTENEKEMYDLALNFARKEFAPNMMQWDLSVSQFHL